MKTSILIGLSMILLCGNAIAANNYIIDNDIVYIDDSKVYLSATPHTLSSSGWVYFNLTSKVYTGKIDACWGFNTSASKPNKADVYNPHWVNTTTNHEKTFYNPTFYVYTGNNLDYGNSYNTNYKYTINETVVNDNGTIYITSNAAFDSFDADGTNYTVYWHNRHDNYYLWKDFSSSFNSIVFDYEGYDKWYYIKNVPITSNKEYTVRAWIDVPVSTEKQSGKYYFAIKPSTETISQAVNNGHFYNLDPWWSATWSTRKKIILTGTGSKSFSNPTEDGDVYSSTKRTGPTYIFIGKSAWGIHRGYSEWDISTIPSDAIITKAIFKYHGYSNAEDCIIKNINIQPSISSASNIYAAIGSGNIYADITGFPEIGNDKQIVLNDNATSDIQSTISTDWFAIGFINKDESNVVAEIYSEDYGAVMPAPTLYVEYTSVSEGGNNQTDYQLLLNVTYEPEMQSDFDDLRFCNETHEIDSWLESKVDDSYALVWVEFPTTPANGVNQTYYMYSGNAGAANYWDGAATFAMFEDFESYADTAAMLAVWSVMYGNPTLETTTVYEGSKGLDVVPLSWMKRNLPLTSNFEVVVWGRYGAMTDDYGLMIRESDADTVVLVAGGYPTVNNWGYRIDANSGGTDTGISQSGINTWHKMTLRLSDSNISFWEDSTLVGNELAYTGVPYEIVLGRENTYQDLLYIYKKVVNPPTYAFGNKSYYVDSIHYNTTIPYNHTIQSDSIIIVNRSITVADDINWTAAALTDDCNLVVTEYNLSNTTVANFTLYTATLDWLKVTNLTVGVEYRLTNNTVYEEHIADASGEINFTNNLIPDDYQIMLASTIVNITCYSVYPETLFTNYTGLLSGSYIVESNFPLNYSSLAFLMGMNYTLTDDYRSYLKVPANSIASDGIYRAHHRNVTPYLSWEGNDTITEANVWKWGGGDNDSFWISKESINATHTWVNITGVASNVLPSMFYLGRLAMYESPKTGVEINKGQGVIFKFWNLESLRGRDCDFWVRMFFDTQIETTPSGAIDIWYCNNSFNPDVDDPVECEYCLRLDTWSSSRWLDHEDYQPHNNVSYSKPLIYYAGEPLTICPDDINYIYLASGTQSSKSYILNATNADLGICNLTYAQTQTMWLRNEVAGTNTPYAYTPSFFMATVRDYLEFTHHLYIANNQDAWGHSDICTVPIGISNMPPTHCRYNYFWWNDTTDYYMNGSYTQNFWINLTYGLDPDNGAPLTHVLSLYDNDNNFIAVINDSLEGNATDVDVFFDVCGYDGMYQLKIVSTDNEGSTSTAWSPVFQLGTRLDEDIPLNLFIVLMWITFGSLFYIYHVETYVAKIVTSLITTWMSFMLSSMIVSGNVVLNYAELTTADTFAHGSTAIQIAAVSHFFMFTGVVSALFMLVFAVKLVIDTYLDMQERKITIEEWDGVEEQ